MKHRHLICFCCACLFTLVIPDPFDYSGWMVFLCILSFAMYLIGSTMLFVAIDHRKDQPHD